MTNAEARCNKSLRPRKPEGSLGRTAQDVHLDSHTAPELCCTVVEDCHFRLGVSLKFVGVALQQNKRFAILDWECHLNLWL